MCYRVMLPLYTIDVSGTFLEIDAFGKASESFCLSWNQLSTCKSSQSTERGEIHKHELHMVTKGIKKNKK